MKSVFLKIIFLEVKGILRKKRFILQFIGLLLLIYLLSQVKKEQLFFFYSTYLLYFYSLSIFIYIDIPWNFFHKEGGINFYNMFPISSWKIMLAHFISIFVLNFFFVFLLSLSTTLITGINMFLPLFYVTGFIVLIIELSFLLGMFPTLHFSIIGMASIILIINFFRMQTYPVIKLFLPPLLSLVYGWITPLDIFSFLIYQCLFITMLFYYPLILKKVIYLR
jgi:hypothetical protein